MKQCCISKKKINSIAFSRFQIDDDLKTKSAELLSQSVDLDKPGFAQFYCLHCAKYFIDDHSMQAHFRTKVHKRRLKALELEPYSIEGKFCRPKFRNVSIDSDHFCVFTINSTESERAAGHGNFKKAEKRIIETQPSKQELAQGKRVVVQKVSDIDTEMQEEATEETD